MIERWKLRRELMRVGEQIRAIPAFLYEPITQRRYDRTRDAQISITDGTAKLRRKVAIFLVYQPNVLAQSVLDTCTYLDSCGYSVLLVANGGLTESSRSSLMAPVWRFMDRPNYGYDFGGYRDGIIKLDDWKISPDRLVILNDSIWFPVHEENSPVILAEANTDAITGLLLHARASRELVQGPEPEGMIESYFFSVPSRIQQHDAFRRFWRNLRLSNAKPRVIHRGERGFSKAMNSAGIPLAALSSRRQFVAAISMSSAEFLRTSLQYAVYIDEGFEKRGASLLESFEPTEDWRAAALTHISATVRRRRFNASFYWAADRLNLTNFMKKNKGELFSRMRRSFMIAVAEGDIPSPGSAVLREISKMSSGESAR